MGQGGFVKTTLSGIVMAGVLQFRTVSYLLPFHDAMLQYHPPTAPSNLFMFQHMVRQGTPDNCVPTMSDPRDEVMAALNEIMFRIGAYWASVSNQSDLELLLDKGVEIRRNITGTLISPVNVFRVNFAYFAGAAIIELFAIGVVMFTLYGWWNLGRNFSFSPLEIGKVDTPDLLASDLDETENNP